jgi:uncharacterized protein YecE (DUF72 family)
VQLHVGTSGFSYDEWRGTFYPEDLPAPAMLGHYSSRLSSVEINNTFYQLPKAPLLERWRDLVPPSFRFALKASRRITHIQRLRDSRETLDYFYGAANVLGERLGPVLFQLPPFAKKDVEILRQFLALLPRGTRAAFEFRNPTWFDDEVYAILSQHGAALCGGDSDEDERSPPLVRTADWGYLRLRAPSYDAAGLADWWQKISAQGFSEAYVYLKHEVLGPLYAEHLAALCRGETPNSLPAPPPPVAAAPKKKPSKSAQKVTPATPAKSRDKVKRSPAPAKRSTKKS